MIESKKIIMKLETLFNRLDNVLEQNLFELFKKTKLNISGSTFKKSTVNKLLMLYPMISLIHRTREQKAFLQLLKTTSLKIKDIDPVVIPQLVALTEFLTKCMYEISVDDTRKVLYGIEIQPALHSALAEAMKKPDIREEASTFCKFVDKYAPASSLTNLDISRSQGVKTFELIESDEDFSKVLKDSSFEELTQETNKIRVFYKEDCVEFTSKEKQEEIQRDLEGFTKKTVSYSVINLLYPETFFKGTYKFYIPNC